MKKLIPNTITVTNLFFGCLALICIFNDKRPDLIHLVPLFLSICLLTDYVDGLAARLLKVTSELGKQMDSLSDMVSFGVVPGAIMYYLINRANDVSGVNFQDNTYLLGMIGFSITLFSCLRLAKFNLDDRQADTFIGLGTPACTILVLGLMMIVNNDTYNLEAYILNAPVLYGFSIALSYLLVAEIPMFSFKFKKMTWAGNRVRFLFILATATIAIVFPIGMALAMIISVYIITSLVLWILGILKLEEGGKLTEREDL